MLISKISDKLGVVDKSTHLEDADTAFDGRKEAEHVQSVPDPLAKTHRNFSRLEEMLNIPVWAREDSRYPDTAFELGVIDATREGEKKSDGMLRPLEKGGSHRGRLDIFRPPTKRRVKSEQGTRVEQRMLSEDSLFKVGGDIQRIEPSLVDRLNIIAPITYTSVRQTRRHSLANDPESQLGGARVTSVGQLEAQQGWIENVERICQDLDAGKDAGELKDYNIVKKEWEEPSDTDDDLPLEPLIILEAADDTNEERNTDKAIQRSWDEYRLQGCNDGLRKKTVELNMAEIEWRKRKKEVERQTQRKAKAERAAQREAQRLERHEQALKKDVLASTDEKIIVIERSQKELTQLQFHHGLFSEWMKTKIVPLLRVELHLARTCIHDRGYLRYLAEKGEVGQPITDVLDWSDTENEDFEEDLSKKIPPFKDSDIRDMLLTEKGDLQRKKLSELSYRMRMMPDGSHFEPSHAKKSIEKLVASPIIFSSWIRQNIIKSPFGFAWAVLLESSLWLFEPSRADVHGVAVGKMSLVFPASQKPGQPIVEMDVLAACFLNDAAHSELKSGSLKVGTQVFTRHKSANTWAAKTLPVRLTDLMGATDRQLLDGPSNYISLRAKVLDELAELRLPGIFTFTAATDALNAEWLQNFHRLWVAHRHQARREKVGKIPWRSLTASLLDPPAQELAITKTLIDAPEFLAVMKDMSFKETGIKHITLRCTGLVSSFWTAMEEGSLQVPPLIESWSIAFNPMRLDDSDVPAFGQFIMKSNARMFCLRSCQMGDNRELGSIIVKLMSEHTHMEFLDLSDNLLASQFVAGFLATVKENQDALQGPPKISLNLSSNAFLNEDATDLIEIIHRFCPKITYVNITNCPTITVTFLPVLMTKYKDLLLPIGVREKAEADPDQIGKIVNVEMKANPLRDALNIYDAARFRTSIVVGDLTFPPRVASSVLARAVSNITCRGFLLSSVSGDLLMTVENIQDAIDTHKQPHWSHLRVFNLAFTRWLSKETSEAASEYFTARGGTGGRDPVLYMMFNLVRFLGVKDLNLSYSPELGHGLIPVQSARFICDLITECQVEQLDLAGCRLTAAHFEHICRMLRERIESDVLAMGTMNQGVGVWKSGKKYVLTAKLNETIGGIWKTWKLNYLILDFNEMGQVDALELVTALLEKCPRLHCVSLIGCGLDEADLRARFKRTVPNFNEIVVRFDDLKGENDYTSLCANYVKERDSKLSATMAEVQVEKQRVITRWLEAAIKNRDARREARYKIRNNRLETFFRETSSIRNERGFNFRMFGSTKELADSMSKRIQRRLNRGGIDLPDGVFPAFRPSRMMLITMGDVGNRMELEFKTFCRLQNEQILDLSNCHFNANVMENIVVSLQDIAKPYRPFLNALYMVNMGLDELHLYDLAALFSVYPVAVTALDMSVNRLAVNDKRQLEAILSIMSILSPRVLVMDANWLFNSKEAALFVFEMLLRSEVRVLSVRMNGLGEDFGAALRELLEFELSRRQIEPPGPALRADSRVLFKKSSLKISSSRDSEPVKPSRTDSAIPSVRRIARRRTLEASSVIDALERTPSSRPRPASFSQTTQHSMSPKPNKIVTKPKKAKGKENMTPVSSSQKQKTPKKGTPGTKSSKPKSAGRRSGSDRDRDRDNDDAPRKLPPDSPRSTQARLAALRARVKAAEAKKAKANAVSKAAPVDVTSTIPPGALSASSPPSNSAGSAISASSPQSSPQSLPVKPSPPHLKVGEEAKITPMKSVELDENLRAALTHGLERPPPPVHIGKVPPIMPAEPIREIVEEEEERSLKRVADTSGSDVSSESEHVQDLLRPPTSSRRYLPRKSKSRFQRNANKTHALSPREEAKQVASGSLAPRKSLSTVPPPIRQASHESLASEPRTSSSSALTIESSESDSEESSSSSIDYPDAPAGRETVYLTRKEDLKEPERRPGSVLNVEVEQRVFARRVIEVTNHPPLEVVDFRNNRIPKQHLVPIAQSLALLCPHLKSVRVAKNTPGVSESTDIDRYLVMFGPKRHKSVELKDAPLPGVIPIPSKLLLRPRVANYKAVEPEMKVAKPSSNINKLFGPLQGLDTMAKGKQSKGESGLEDSGKNDAVGVKMEEGVSEKQDVNTRQSANSKQDVDSKQDEKIGKESDSAKKEIDAKIGPTQVKKKQSMVQQKMIKKKNPQKSDEMTKKLGKPVSKLKKQALKKSGLKKVGKVNVVKPKRSTQMG